MRRKSFEAVTMHMHLDCASNNYFRLSCAVRSALEALYDPGGLYRGCGVVGGPDQQGRERYDGLFGVMQADARQGELLRTVAAVNRRYGRQTITMATEGVKRQDGQCFIYPLLTSPL